MSYRNLSHRPQARKKRRWPQILAVVFAALLVMYVFVAKASPALEPITKEAANQSAGHTASLPWPAYGQSAIGAMGYGVLASNNAEQKPVPMASLAKTMTALAILNARPLEPNEQGPNIPITAEDVALFNEYTAKNGTSTKVVEGQQISEYQALQSMLIRSSNNMADTLSRWAFGSSGEFLTYANQYAKELGMDNTHFADASGFSPETVSTAEDLVLLGEAAMANPVIAEVVAQWQANIPEAGLIQNTNLFLDFEGNGVVGIKSGETEQAGGCYLVAANATVADGKQVTLVAATLGAPSHFAAQKDTMPLLETAKNSFYPVKVMKQGEVVGHYSPGWDGTVEAVASADVDGLGWADKPLYPIIELDTIHSPRRKGAEVGSIRVSNDSPKTAVILQKAILNPSVAWRAKYLLERK